MNICTEIRSLIIVELDFLLFYEPRTFKYIIYAR